LPAGQTGISPSPEGTAFCPLPGRRPIGTGRFSTFSPPSPRTFHRQAKIGGAPKQPDLPAPLIRLPSPPNGAIRLTAAPPGYRRLPSSTPRSEGRDRPGQAPHSAGRPKVNHRNSIILGESIIDNDYQYQYINISNPGGGSRPVPLPEKKHPLPWQWVLFRPMRAA
jgi:hypothetical protein